MAHNRVLVVGAGVAGSALAFWLAKGGFQVTVVERSAKENKYGQGIDVEGPGQDIVRWMGLEQQIKDRGTGELGFTSVDDNGKAIASIDGLLTRQIEVMRGDLTEILATAAASHDNVTYQYGATIRHIGQTPDKATATFDDGSQADFEIVVGADGLRSRTRSIILDEDEDKRCRYPRDQYIAYFTIARDQDDAQRSRWQNITGGRTILVRPVDSQNSSAYIGLNDKSDMLENALAGDRQTQKDALAKAFAGVGGLAPRVMAQMMKADNFYFERLVQIKLDSWSRGRCALVGDAAYAPSPITGEGTNLALVGAYVLAGELSEKPDDPVAAFKAYEDQLRVFVKSAQTIPLGGRAPDIANPQTWWGIWILRTIFWFIATTGVWKLIDTTPEHFDLPPYPKMRTTDTN